MVNSLNIESFVLKNKTKIWFWRLGQMFSIRKMKLQLQFSGSWKKRGSYKKYHTPPIYLKVWRIPVTQTKRGRGCRWEWWHRMVTLALKIKNLEKHNFGNLIFGQKLSGLYPMKRSMRLNLVLLKILWLMKNRFFCTYYPPSSQPRSQGWWGGSATPWISPQVPLPLKDSLTYSILL